MSQLPYLINIKASKTYSKKDCPEYLTSSAIITPCREVKTTFLESERRERLKLYAVKRSKVSDHDVILSKKCLTNSKALTSTMYETTKPMFVGIIQTLVNFWKPAPCVASAISS